MVQVSVRCAATRPLPVPNRAFSLVIEVQDTHALESGSRASTLCAFDGLLTHDVVYR